MRFGRAFQDSAGLLPSNANLRTITFAVAQRLLVKLTTDTIPKVAKLPGFISGNMLLMIGTAFRSIAKFASTLATEKMPSIATMFDY